MPNIKDFDVTRVYLGPYKLSQLSFLIMVNTAVNCNEAVRTLKLHIKHIKCVLG